MIRSQMIQAEADEIYLKLLAPTAIRACLGHSETGSILHSTKRFIASLRGRGRNLPVNLLKSGGDLKIWFGRNREFRWPFVKGVFAKPFPTQTIVAEKGKNMGRPRKPSHLKVIENTRDRRPWALQAREPVSPHELESPPEFLSANQQEIWDKALAKMPNGLLRAIDSSAFAAWVACYDRFQRANEALQSSPMVVRGSSGSAMQSPWSRIARQESLLLRALSSELGFSPVSRTRIALEPPVEDDDPKGYFS